MISFAGKPHSIATACGYFDLADPRPEAVDMHDIAAALSRVIRFGGHGINPPSVAAHSVLCWRIACLRDLPQAARRAVLMHDAAEAYVGDVVRPLKSMVPQFAAIEAAVAAAIAARFCLRFGDYGDVVKRIDNLALAIERTRVFPDHAPWPGFPDPSPALICALPTNEAAQLAFMTAAAVEGLV